MGRGQAPSPPAAAAAAASPTVKSYAAPNGDVEGWATKLRAEFENRPSVRIAADPRTKQILVQAAPEVHAQVEKRLAAAPQATTPNKPAAERSKTSSSVVPLRHHTGKQIEESLVALFGARLTPVASAETGTGSYVLSGTLRIDVQQQTNRVSFQGPSTTVDSLTRLVQALDAADAGPEKITRTVTLERSSPATVRRTVDAIAASEGIRQARQPLVATLFQKGDERGNARLVAEPRETPPAAPTVPPAPGTPAAPAAPTAPAAPAAPGAAPAAGKPPEGSSMIGPVQVEMLDPLDVLILRGHQRDVERVMEVIAQIEKLAADTDPTIVVHQLRHVDSAALTELIAPLYDQMYALRQGFVSINALVKPNALLLVGRRESVHTVVDLVKKLDKPVDPQTQFQVFRLRSASALTVQQTVLDFFAMRMGLGPRVRATADYRSNALVVQASPRDLAEVAALIERLDTQTSDAVNELRVFQLENSMAEELAPILQSAITGQPLTGRTGVGGAFPQLPGLGAAAGAQAGLAQRTQDQKSMMLRFVTVDTRGQRKLESGILTDVRITADTRANALLVSAPAESMELLEALIRQLDRLPAAEAQIKVFTIVNGDATSLIDMLQALFARAQTGPTIQLGAGGQIGSISGDNQIVTLRFAVDVRTNSIIASGTPGDLQVVEAILLRLDDSDVRHRKSVVYRLKNAPSIDVANAINQFLQTERQVQQVSPGLISPFEQIEREVVVVPEPVSNSLIVSATPRYFEEIKKIVEELDQRPPMVLIQVLIAEVVLNKTDEFGVELGLQDSILFDRSLLGNITTLTRTTYDTSGNPASQNQEIASATYTPGFAFNNQPLGQSSGQGTSNIVGTQGLSSFSLGRANNDLGFGGLVLTASSESISMLVRALKECRRLDVLSRPQVMTLDNQPAFIQVGQRVPRIVGTTVNQTAQVNNITLENVGLIMGVTPRISPEGLIVMEIDAEKSEVGPEAEGIPVSISATGQVIRSPRIDTITAQTTVSAANGQTIVLGGLINKRKTEFHRKVPFLGDIPILGYLFRYDGVSNQKTELLIVMTPHVVRTEADAEKLKRLESARMHWCLADVLAVHGMEVGPKRQSNWSDAETTVVYPDNNPAGTFVLPETVTPPARNGAEMIPVPGGQSVNGAVPNTMPPDASPALPGYSMPATPRYAPPQRPIIPGPSFAPPPASPTPATPPATTPLDPFPAEPMPSPLTPPSGTNSGVQLRLRSAPSPTGPSQGDVRPATYQAGVQPGEMRGYTPPPAPSQTAVPATYVAPAAAPSQYAPPGYAPPTVPASGYAPPAYAPPAYAPPR